MLTSLILCLVLGGETVFTSLAPQGTPTKSFDFKNVLLVGPTELEELKKTPTLLQVYFIAEEYFFFSLKEYFNEYEKAAKYLKNYNIQIAMLDCTLHKEAVDYCKEKDVKNHVFSFQNGKQKLKFDSEAMFDVNAIMAHSIHILLDTKVPIFQSRLEKTTRENQIAGKKNMIFAFVPYLGSKEHRIIIEVAYAYQDSYLFSMTTDAKVTEGLKGADSITPDTQVALWALFCADTTEDELLKSIDCDHLMFQGNFTLDSLAAFIKNLEEPVLYQAPSKDVTTFLDMLGPSTLIFVYTKESLNSLIQKDLQVLARNVRGLAKIVILDMSIGENVELAQEQGFLGKLPSVSIRKKDGVIVFMSQSAEWNLESVKEFVESVLKASITKSLETIEKEQESEFSSDLRTFSQTVIKEVETQDDEVADAVFKLKLENMDLTFIPPLFKETFAAAIESSDLKLVLFYLHFDHVGMAFLADLAQHASNYSESGILARVNCYDATDLCADLNITTYPLMRIFQKGMEPQDYKGHLHSESVLHAIKLLQVKSPVKLKTEEEVEQFMNGEFPINFSNASASSVIFVPASDSLEMRKIFKEVSKTLSTVTAFGMVAKQLAESVAKKYGTSAPSVIARCRPDADRPIRILTDVTKEKLVDFVKMSTFKSLPELTVNNFPTLYAKKLPFVILFVNPAEEATTEAVKLMTKLSLSGKFDNLLFCMMNAAPKTLGLKILSAYTWTATLPMISLVNHRTAEVFNYVSKSLKEEEVVDWLNGVLIGGIEPSKQLQQATWTAPGKYYDFLALSDAVKALEKSQAAQTEEETKPAIEGSAENSTDSNEDELLKEDEDARRALFELRRPRFQSSDIHVSAQKPDLNREHVQSDAPAHIEL